MSEKKDEKKVTIVADTGASSMRTLEALSILHGHPQQERKIIPVRAKPDMAGSVGNAWLCDLKRMKRESGIDDEADSTLVHWVVEAPWAHPIWSHYSLVLIHLRPLAKNPQPLKFYIPGATHELWVMACSPEKDLTGVVRGDAGSQVGAWLSPKNFGSQMIYRSDAEAEERVESAVREIVEGQLSPDTDFQQMWIERFGNPMIKDQYR